MRRAIFCVAITVPIFLATSQKLALGQYIVPQAKTSAGPALASFNGTTIVAWAGASGTAHKVGYTTYAQNTGLGTKPTGYSPQQFVCDACTTVAPSLAPAASALYLAMRGSSAQAADNIYYSVWNATGSKGFAKTLTKLCAGTTCPETTASPALAGDGVTLYAAWTTATDTIDYAILASGSWSVATGPNVSTNPPDPDTGPSLAVYNNTLYVAWVTACGAIEYATLPLSPAATWSSPSAVPGAKSSVAPALGISYHPPHAGLPSSFLDLAWTTPSTAGYTIKIVEWNGSGWGSASQANPQAGPMENLTPALFSYINDNTLPCVPLYYNFIVAYSMALSHEGDIGVNDSFTTGPAPKNCNPKN